MHPDWRPYLVRAKTRSLDGKAADDFQLPETARVPLLVSVRLPRTDHDREPTGRTRTFLFLSIAGVAASLLDARQVVVCENGQGSLGPSLIPGPWEFDFRGTHPGFTRRLAHLLHLVTGKRIPVEHPFLDHTKGDVLRRFSKPELRRALAVTNSCVRYPLRHKAVRPAMMCGVCGGCLLRRVSLVAAGHEDLERGERYFWKDLSALALAAGSVAGRTTDRDQRIAYQSALDMANLARLAERNGDSVSIRRVASEYAIARNVGMSDAVSHLQQLVQQHRRDWNAFVSKLGPESWIRILTGAEPDA